MGTLLDCKRVQLAQHCLATSEKNRYPITQQYGVNPVWFGVFVAEMMVLAGISPPVGLSVFVVRSVCPHIPILKIYKGAFPFIAICALVILCICIWPDIVLAPVRSMMGSTRY